MCQRLLAHPSHLNPPAAVSVAAAVTGVSSATIRRMRRLGSLDTMGTVGWLTEKVVWGGGKQIKDAGKNQ